jgi:hypothetical protein
MTLDSMSYCFVGFILASPTVSTLNRLAQIMQNSGPIYEETRKILGFIDERAASATQRFGADFGPETASGADGTHSNHGPDTCHTVIESPRSKYAKNVM